MAAAPVEMANRWRYRVNFGATSSTFTESDLQPYDDAAGEASLTLDCRRWGGLLDLARRVTLAKLDPMRPLRDVLLSYRACRTEFKPYQFKPLLKFLDTPRGRLLIADEVGLGKTIEAGYILRELEARRPQSFRRVLVMCPAPLLTKWQEELEGKFDLRFEVMDAATFRKKIIGRMSREGEQLRFAVIVSKDTLRGDRAAELQPDQRSLLAEFETALQPRGEYLDLVIVDEAHHLRNPAAQTHKAGRVLAEHAEAMLLLSATPINNSSDDLYHLLNLLDPVDFDNKELFQARLQANRPVVLAELHLREGKMHDAADELERLLAHPTHPRLFGGVRVLQDTVARLRGGDPADVAGRVDLQRRVKQLNLLDLTLTRTLKRDVDIAQADRVPQPIDIRFSAAEQALYDEVSTYCSELYELHHGERAAQFATINMQQQLASCIPAFLRRLAMATPPDASSTDPTARDADDDEGEAEGFSIWRDEGFRCEVLRLAEAISHDTKFEALLGALRKLAAEDAANGEAPRKVLLFSFFRGTLAYLEERLSAAGIGCRRIAGDVRREEREERIAAFRENPGVRVLLSSRVGSEGLDFQRHCHVLVNYDLPWNPMRVEQRIGRIDRFGQPSAKVLIYHFVNRGTIDGRILDRLYAKVGVFEHTIGHLEPILGSPQLRDLNDLIMSNRLTDTERERKAELGVLVRLNLDQLQQALDERKHELLGQDEALDERLRQIDGTRQYLTGEELEAFVAGFFADLGQPWSPQPNEPHVWRAVWSNAVQRCVDDELTVEEKTYGLWSRLQRYETLRLTTVGEAAAGNGQATELLHARHPIVRAAAARYGAGREGFRLLPGVRVELDRGAVDPWLQEHLNAAGGASWFFVLFRSEQVGGPNPGFALEPVFLGQIDALKEAAGRALLHLIGIRGRDWDPGPNIAAGEIEAQLARAEEVLITRLDDRRDRLEAEVDHQVNRRIAYQRQRFSKEREEQERRIETLRQRRPDVPGLRGFEARLNNLLRDEERTIARLQETRGVSIPHEFLTLGALRIV